MDTQHVKVEAFLNCPGTGRQPEQEALLLAAADASDTARATGELTTERLHVPVKAVLSPSVLVWQEAVACLGRISESCPGANAASLELSDSPKAEVRSRALFCLRAATSLELADETLRAAITDRSAKVRWRAAERIERLEKRHLLPELASALAAETNNVTRSVAHDALRLPRAGYMPEPWMEGFQSLAARRREGGSVQLVSEPVLQDGGIDSLVREHREAAERLGGDQVPDGSRTPS